MLPSSARSQLYQKATPLVAKAHSNTCRRPPRHRIARPSPVQAAFWSSPDDVASAVRLGTSLAVAVGMGVSLLPILTGDSKERNERRFLRPNPEEGDENVKWGVMSVLAVAPFFNPMGWVFGALSDEDSSTLYYTFAAIYATPYLTNGLQLDSFAVAMLVLGAVHMQIERVAQTEPAEIEIPTVLRALLRGLPRAATALGRYGSSVGSEVSERVQRSAEAQGRRPDRKYLEERSREARAELESFDRRAKEKQHREKERQSDGN